MFKNGTLWNDIDGNPIHAHGGWMLSYGGYFYWYGEDRRENYYTVRKTCGTGNFGTTF